MTEPSWDPEQFEKQWIAVNEEVIKRVMADSTIQQIKERVRTKGKIDEDDRNDFIGLVNKLKYDVIYETFGKEGSASYEEFLQAWQHWQKLRGTGRPQGTNIYENNINHLLYGSTPDPDYFLQDFDINQNS